MVSRDDGLTVHNDSLEISPPKIRTSSFPLWIFFVKDPIIGFLFITLLGEIYFDSVEDYLIPVVCVLNNRSKLFPP